MGGNSEPPDFGITLREELTAASWLCIVLVLLLGVGLIAIAPHEETIKSKVAYDFDINNMPKLYPSHDFMPYYWKRFRAQKELISKLERGGNIAQKVNYKFLQFDMGCTGKKMLTRLLRLKKHPQYATIKSEIKRIEGYNSWGEWFNSPIYNIQPAAGGNVQRAGL